jgi:hypothetical protein
MGVADDALVALPVDLPNRVQALVAIVLWDRSLSPAHETRLMPEMPKHAAKDRGWFDPNNLLVIQNAELAPNLDDVEDALVGVPTIDGRVGR